MSTPALPRHRSRSGVVHPTMAMAHAPVEAPPPAPSQEDRMRALELEVAQLRTAMASRASIEQAKGVLMLLTGCDDERSFQLLTHISSHTHRKVREVAAELVDSAAGRRELPADVRTILRDACPPTPRTG